MFRSKKMYGNLILRTPTLLVERRLLPAVNLALALHSCKDVIQLIIFPHVPVRFFVGRSFFPLRSTWKQFSVPPSS